MNLELIGTKINYQMFINVKLKKHTMKIQFFKEILFIALVLNFITLNAQSKKEQIMILENRVDSLNEVVNVARNNHVKNINILEKKADELNVTILNNLKEIRSLQNDIKSKNDTIDMLKAEINDSPFMEIPSEFFGKWGFGMSNCKGEIGPPDVLFIKKDKNKVSIAGQEWDGDLYYIKDDMFFTIYKIHEGDFETSANILRMKIMDNKLFISYQQSEFGEGYMKCPKTYSDPILNDMDFETIEIVKEEVDEEIQVPFAVVENVPVFPGCENKSGNQAKKDCMSEKISQFVSVNFNTELAGDLGLSGRQNIIVTFKIDKNGNITNVITKAQHPGLEREAVRVINQLPKMQPGKLKGENVTVQYSLPIIFTVRE